ncbi:hypothetical protein BK133_22400 [Paenibacillus sp. FSL H8-0548]|uniref:XdhC family protein n=1 Tax=Paenibacillus sp. FSL H8-0548 TaxID=1920422 RepID=UPI00096FA919|nr:XdhC family protein [Paenibacillus sp. FSL H8-0548]OMF24847.1 hypothetical protein BK133_22400 [Paenibacillus sp. FSL H8-0548]
MDMHDVLVSVMKEAGRAVLATIICVDGHSYRKAGAAMLFQLGNEQIGSLSPGCLENDLLERAERVWESGQFERIDYNLKQGEDVIWGESIGCGGEIRILLEPVDVRLRAILLKIKERNDMGTPVRLTRSWEADEMSYTLHDDIQDGTGNFIMQEADQKRLSIQISPRPRLVLFGAGKDADAIYGLVRHIGFQVVVTDWRSSLCTQERYPEADCIVGSPEQIVEQLSFRTNDYLIVCSHHLQQDKEMIRLALPLQLVYIGIMGSKQRIRTLFETFLIPSNVRAPIGLSIGADGPNEIAVSVAAELIAIRAGHEQRSQKERIKDGYFSPLFGRRTEQANGGSQAISRAGEK